MKQPKDVSTGLLRWCTRIGWDLLLILFSRPDATTAETNQHFHEWILEVERELGTPDFRWARILPRNEGEPPAGFFVLIGGLSSEDLASWRRRWCVISGAPRERSGSLYSQTRDGRRMGSLLRSLLEQGDFDIEVRVGPRIERPPHRRPTTEAPQSL